MRAGTSIIMMFALVSGLVSPAAHAQERAEYERRSIARFVEMFAASDLNHSGQVTHLEVSGNVEFTAVFDDIDINRDGVVTRGELERYLTLRFGYVPPRQGARP